MTYTYEDRRRLHAVNEPASPMCAYCGKPAEGNHTIHRDGFLFGPEVPLCDTCGSNPEPSCIKIWARISLVDATRWTP
jgi:hypothetical protein